MLRRPGSDQPLPQNDLVFLSFFLTANRTLFEIDRLRQIEQSGQSLETWLGGDEEPESGPRPYLAWTPLLAGLPARIQLDLLAETWRKHDARRTYRATLVDGCVVNAACMQARLLLEQDDEFAETLLEDSPRQLDLRLDEWARERLRLIYPRWWRSFNPVEFREISALEEEFTPRQVAQVREAAARTRSSPDVERNLAGLLSRAEIRRSRGLLDAEG
jgi:hypothetical protein